jgi:hypothetical protein
MWIKEVRKQVNLLSYQWKTHLMNEEFLWVLTWKLFFWFLWNGDNIKDLVDMIPMFVHWVAKIDGSLYLLLIVQGTNFLKYKFLIFFVDCCN